MHTFDTWESTGEYFTYKNRYSIFIHTSIPSEVSSDKPVLLLLHGFPTSSWDWHKVLPELTQHFQVIAPDFIGFGLSAKPSKYTYSIMDQADLMDGILRKYKIKNYHILAHDYGDTVAQELLARHRENSFDSSNNNIFTYQLKSVAFLNGGIFPDAHQPLPIQKALMSPIGFLLTPFLNKNKLRKSFQRIFGQSTQPTEQEIDEFYQLIERANGKYIFHKLIRYMAERRTHQVRWLQALQQDSVPMRLINGVVDPISGQQMADHYQKVVPDADVVLLEQIGHYPQTEAPAEVLKHFLYFHHKG